MANQSGNSDRQRRRLVDHIETVVAEATDRQDTHMPQDEFLKLFGLPILANGLPDLGLLFKACFDIHDNPTYRALPSEKRIAALQTANTVMSNLRGG